MKKNKKRQSVYVMKNELGLYKVGISHDVEKRRQAIQNTSGFRVKVVKILNIGGRSAYRVEQAIHKELGLSRKRGEWFRCSLGTIDKASRKAINYARQSKCADTLNLLAALLVHFLAAFGWVKLLTAILE